MSHDPNVVRHLEEVAGKTPRRAAIIEPGGGIISFGDLDRRTARIAGGLADRGLRPGDRLLLMAPMSITFYEALIAAFRGLQTAVLMDPRAPGFDETLRALDLKALIGSPAAQLLRLKHPGLRGLGHYLSTARVPLPHDRLDRLRGEPRPLPAPPAELPALLTYTTGSTGHPKAVARTHGFLNAQHRVLAGHMGLGPHDIDLPTLPIFLLNSLAAGATCVLPDADLRHVGRVRPGPVIRQLRKWRCTVSSGSPAFFARIARALRDSGVTLPHLRRLFVGGARVPTSLLEDLVTVAPRAHVEILYGSTEAEPIARLDAREALDETAGAEAQGRGCCVGRPVPGLQVRILRPGTAVELPDGEIGEVVVAGAHVNRGYYRDPEADARHKLHDAGRIWHRTGDGGYLDGKRRIWLVGRVDERVCSHHPFMVEAPLDALPWIERSALIDVDGEAVLACSVKSPPAHWPDLVRERSGVDRVVELRRIPLDPRHNAKVDRGRTLQRVRARLTDVPLG